MSDENDPLEELRAASRSAGFADGARSTERGVSLEDVDALVARVVQEPERRSLVRRAAPAFLVAAAVLAVAIAFVVVPSGTTASAEAPPVLSFELAQARDLVGTVGVDPTDVLNDLADAAARQKLPEGEVSRTVNTDNWFGESVNNANPVIVPRRTSNTVNPDGSVHTVELVGRPLSADGRGIDPDVKASGKPYVDEMQPPGSLDPDVMADLPRDPDQLREALLDRIDCLDRELGPVRSHCLFTQIVGLHYLYPVQSDLESAMWRMLADEDAIVSLGEVEDRANRPGIAISMVSPDPPDFRLVLIIDPSTGHLLGYEEIQIRPQKSSDLVPPAIASFTTFLD